MEKETPLPAPVLGGHSPSPGTLVSHMELVCQGREATQPVHANTEPAYGADSRFSYPRGSDCRRTSEPNKTHAGKDRKAQEIIKKTW